MNILFLGNSLLLTAVRHLPKLLNQLPQKDLHIQLVYIASGKTHVYVNNFDRSMKEYFTIKKGKSNLLWTYVYGHNRWKEDVMPDISIREVLTNTKWDIVITCSHSARTILWKYEKYKSKYDEYFQLIRQCTDAKLYWVWTFTPNREFCDEKLLVQYDDVAKNRWSMYKLLNKVDDTICTNYNLHPLRLRVAYEMLTKKYPKHHHLIIDSVHPDRGIGEYFCCAYFYNVLFKKYYYVNLSDLQYSYDATKYTYENGDHCIPVNKENKKIIDEIADLCYI